jgi:segregation and condensation protein B
LNPELALEDDDLAGMRVLDLPPIPLEDDVEDLDADDSDDLDSGEGFLDEEEAIALAKRPLDEILGIGQFGARNEEKESRRHDDSPDAEEQV